MKCQEVMEQVLPEWERVLVLEEARDKLEVVDGWVARLPVVQVETVFARNVVMLKHIKEDCPALSESVLSAVQL